jgi:hypothetical protein
MINELKFPVNTNDDLLQGFSIQELIDTVVSNEEYKSEYAIKLIFRDLIKAKVKEAESALKENMKLILHEINR